MNTGYLSSLYVISQSPSDSDEHVSVEKLIPPDILKLIRNHRYTAAYKSKEDNYDFLAEKIDNVDASLENKSQGRAYDTGTGS